MKISQIQYKPFNHNPLSDLNGWTTKKKILKTKQKKKPAQKQKHKNT